MVAILVSTSVVTTAFAAGPSPGELTLSGAYKANLELDHANCNSVLHPAAVGHYDNFVAIDPSFAEAENVVWNLSLTIPSSKSSPIIGTVLLTEGTSGWEVIYREARDIPTSEVNFASNGKAGRLDLVLQPEKDTQPPTHGTVRVVASWSAGTCSNSSKYIGS
jgi:hypothetical protein